MYTSRPPARCACRSSAPPASSSQRSPLDQAGAPLANRGPRVVAALGTDPALVGDPLSSNGTHLARQGVSLETRGRQARRALVPGGGHEDLHPDGRPPASLTPCENRVMRSSSTVRCRRCSTSSPIRGNEPRYNPRMVRAEQISTGPIGLGTRFETELKTMCRTMPMTVEFTVYERPRRLGSFTRSSMMETEGALTFESVANSTRMSWSWDVRAGGPLML
jgi:hypothetical protein